MSDPCNPTDCSLSGSSVHGIYNVCVRVYSCCYLVNKSCPTLCEPMDCNPQGFSVHRISQARILEWVAISFSRGSSQSRNQTHISCIGRRTLYHKGSSVFAYVKNKNSQTTKCVSSFESLIAPSMAYLSLA